MGKAHLFVTLPESCLSTDVAAQIVVLLLLLQVCLASQMLSWFSLDLRQRDGASFSCIHLDIWRRDAGGKLVEEGF